MQGNEYSEDIDWEQLHELSGDDHEFEQELLQIFFQDCQVQMERLQEAWRVSDLAEVRQVAHHIKGASANVGAIALSQLAAQLEEDARNLNSAPITASLQVLSQRLEGLQRHLENP